MSDSWANRPIAVNGRFIQAPVSGVERYARGLLGALRASTSASLAVIAPPDHIGSERLLDDASSLGPAKLTGLRGHAWEQFRLPRLYSRANASALLSLCNWGPLSVPDQLVVLHDAAPYVAKTSFSAAYGAWARLFAKRLARGRQTIGTVSEFSKRMLMRELALDPDRVLVIPPGLSAPFDAATPRLDGAGEFGLLVGGHIARKNVGFAIDAWEPIWRESRLPLHVVARPSASSALRTRAAKGPDPAHVVVHDDVDDDRLIDLYTRAVCVLSPSLHEGFGLPLLEAMATGTPFLSSPTGAADELAVQPDQVLPLDTPLWTARIRALLESDTTPLRQASVERAHAFTWERSAQTLAERLRAGL